MNTYYALLLFLVVIPFLFGQLYSSLMAYNPVLLSILVTGLLFALVIKLARDKRKATKDLWRDRLSTLEGTSQNVDLSVVVPAYNEEQRLPNMLNEAITFLENRCRNSSKLESSKIYKCNKFTYEIVIVDDGSSDGTTKCGLQYRERYGDKKIRVITLAKNKGKGGAVRVGVLAARGNYIMFADADGASKFSDIEKLEEFMLANRDQTLVMSIGSRAHMEEEAIATRSLFRTILMKGFHLLVWTCCVRSVRDTQCGFKMFNQQTAQLLFTNYHNESWAFDVEMLYLAEQVKCTIGEVPINWTEVEGSKIVPVFSWVRMGWDVLCLATLYSLGVYCVPQNNQATNRTKR